MSCCGGAAIDETTKEIDRLIKKEARQFREQVKLLLLGPGESGKSTIFKQMKIIQINGGFTQKELEAFRPVIYNNLISQMKVLVNAAERLGIPILEYNKPQAMALNELSGTGTTMGGGWTTELGIGIKSLWADPGIRAAYAAKDSDVNHRTVHFHLNDSASYFFDNIDRYLVPDFIPSEQDALRARVRSTGIDEAEFAFQDLSFKMVDVGGQRSERRKWIHCFESVTAILYVCSLSEYDQYLREDETQLRMHESLLLFDEICNNQVFRRTSIILFLNKEDLFREKIQKVDLRICFPNYDGGPSFENASPFIRDQFLAKNLQPARTIFVHFTCAINTENIEFVFKSVRKTLLDRIVDEMGVGGGGDDGDFGV